MEKLRFIAPVVEIREPTRAESMKAALSPDKPRFMVKLLLALADKKNGNRHKLPKAEIEAAIKRNQIIPGNFNHDQAKVAGASGKIYVEDRDDSYSAVMLEGVYWKRCIDDDMFGKVMAEYDAGKLGASWEIDNYNLDNDPEDEEAIVVKDFEFSGFGIMVGQQPAEAATTGQVAITAAQAATEEDKKKQEERAKRTGIAIKPDGHVTKPSEYADVPDSKFADETNFKWPLDEAHIQPAVQYFNHEGMREKGGYTTEEWAKIGGRIANAAGKGYKYENGKITTPNTANQGGNDMSDTITTAEVEKQIKEAVDAAIKTEQANADKDKTDAVEKAKVDSEKDHIDAYRKKLDAGAERFDQMKAYKKYETGKEILEAMLSFADMTPEAFELQVYKAKTAALETENASLKEAQKVTPAPIVEDKKETVPVTASKKDDDLKYVLARL